MNYLVITFSCPCWVHRSLRWALWFILGRIFIGSYLTGILNYFKYWKCVLSADCWTAESLQCRFKLLYLQNLGSQEKFEKLNKKGKDYNVVWIFCWINWIAYSHCKCQLASGWAAVGNNRILSIYSSGLPSATNRAPSFLSYTTDSPIVSLFDLKKIKLVKQIIIVYVFCTRM